MDARRSLKTKTMNKLIITSLIVLMSIFSAQAQESAKWYTNFEEAAKLSLKINKPILANFTGSDWCGWCIRLKKEVFDKAEFKNWANENVILLELDFPRRKKQSDEIKTQNKNLQKTFGVRGYPTIHLFDVSDKNGKLELIPIKDSGYVAGGPKAFIKSLSKTTK
jgi:protein disulfide-isomerase